eukprot:3131158-Amphidinium_carterae.1
MKSSHLFILVLSLVAWSLELPGVKLAIDQCMDLVCAQYITWRCKAKRPLQVVSVVIGFKAYRATSSSDAHGKPQVTLKWARLIF